MKTRDSFLGMALLCLTVAGCQCSSPPVKEHLKPEGMPCEADSECETGLCDALPGQSKLCIRKCTDGCLVNEVCEPLGTDRYACVPDAAKLCEACTVDSDCPYPGDKCVQLGGALVCARDCSFDGTCPDSFQCGQAIDADESLLQSQCTPKSGTCECTAASDGQTVPCQSTNSYGTCQGVKTCSAQSGYSTCNARTPTAEVCNGVDDDCNGQTDENLGETTCGTGECQVTVSNCANGEPQTCTPHEPAAEVCDDKDNDCDQQIDEDFDNTIQPYAGVSGGLAAVDARQNLVVEVNGKRLEVSLPEGAIGGGGGRSAKAPRSRSRKAAAAASGDALVAPMQGTIVKVEVTEGQQVQTGDLLVVLEAMKMEQPLTAHKAGVVTNLNAEPGSTVPNGTVLLEIKGE